MAERVMFILCDKIKKVVFSSYIHTMRFSCLYLGFVCYTVQWMVVYQ